MDDLYAINVAKSEFRDCFNLADTSRLLAIADPDLVNFSDGQPSEFGGGGLDALKTRLANLFERFTAKLAVIVIEIRIQGDVAVEYRSTVRTVFEMRFHSLAQLGRNLLGKVIGDFPPYFDATYFNGRHSAFSFHHALAFR